MVNKKRIVKNVIVDLMGWTIFGPIVRKLTERSVSRSTKLYRIKNMTAMLCQQIRREYADVLSLE